MRKTLPLLIVVLLLAAPGLACAPGTPAGPLVFSPETLPEAQVGQPYEVEIQLSAQVTPAFEMSVDEGALPAGLTGVFDQGKQSFTISGTPTEAGTYDFSVRALCYGTSVSGQMGNQPYSLVVAP